MNVCQNTLDLVEWDVSHVTVTPSVLSKASATINQVNANVNQVSLVTNVTNVKPITLAYQKRAAPHVTVTWTGPSSLNATTRATVSVAPASKVKSVTNAKKTTSTSVPAARNATTATIWLVIYPPRCVFIGSVQDLKTT